MKTFLIISVGLLTITLGIVITVFLYLSFTVMPAREQSNLVPSVAVEQPLTLPALPIGTTTPSTTKAVVDIPLRDVPLSTAQQSVLETVGVDTDTFVITPEMQRCAEEKIGQTRVAEIVAGDAPSALETAKLLTCL